MKCFLNYMSWVLGSHLNAFAYLSLSIDFLNKISSSLVAEGTTVGVGFCQTRCPGAKIVWCWHIKYRWENLINQLLHCLDDNRIYANYAWWFALVEFTHRVGILYSTLSWDHSPICLCFYQALSTFLSLNVSCWIQVFPLLVLIPYQGWYCLETGFQCCSIYLAIQRTGTEPLISVSHYANCWVQRIMRPNPALTLSFGRDKKSRDIFRWCGVLYFRAWEDLAQLKKVRWEFSKKRHHNWVLKAGKILDRGRWTKKHGEKSFQVRGSANDLKVKKSLVY